MKTNPASLLASTTPWRQVFISSALDAGATSAVINNVASSRPFIFRLMTALLPPHSWFLFMLWTANFFRLNIARDWRIHGNVVAPLFYKLRAKRKIIALHRQPRLTLQLLRPIAEIVSMPRCFRLERGQAETLPDRLCVVHELALGQCDRCIDALEQRVDEDCRAFAIVARTTRSVTGILVLQDLEIVLRLATV